MIAYVKHSDFAATFPPPPAPERVQRDELENDHYLATLQLASEIEPEVRLWRHVIIQAFCDAREIGLTEEQRVHIPRARAWLTKMGRDFVDVCLNADLEAERVCAVARRMAAAGWA